MSDRKKLVAVRLVRVLTALVFMPLLLVAAVGCGAGGKALIYKAESIDSGKMRYDDFFGAVITVRDNVEELDSDLFPVREPLVDALNLSVDVALASLVAKVRRQVKKQRNFGVQLNLRLFPTPKLITHKGSFDSTDTDETFVRALEESANRAVSTYREYRKLLRGIGKLKKKRVALAEGLDKLDRGYTKRAMVERELVAAGRILDKAEKKLYRDTRTLAFLLVALADAADSGAADLRATACDEALKKCGKKRRRRVRGRRGRPRARPRPRPRGGDDFSM